MYWQVTHVDRWHVDNKQVLTAKLSKHRGNKCWQVAHVDSERILITNTCWQPTHVNIGDMVTGDTCWQGTHVDRWHMLIVNKCWQVTHIANKHTNWHRGTCWQVTQSELDMDTVRTILSEYKIHNADISLRYDATAEDLIDVIEGNRVYVPCIYLLNKIDQISIEVNVYKLHLPAQQDRPDLYRGKCVQTTSTCSTR